MKFNDTPPRCPICGSHVLQLYGCGWDYDRWVCGRLLCDYEKEFETTTDPEDDDIENRLNTMRDAAKEIRNNTGGGIMDYKAIEAQITNEEGVYMWNGEVMRGLLVRRQLWAHWQQCDGKPVRAELPTNMHEDSRCVDRRYLTTDPDNWKAPKKRTT